MLIDTSAWIEYLRDAHQGSADAVDRLLRSGEGLTTSPVVMEVLAGARSPRHRDQLEGLLGGATLVRCEHEDFIEAALLYRLCRVNGETVRSMVDCLIAAVAVRTGTPVLHHDRDFDALARHTPLVATSG